MENTNEKVFKSIDEIQNYLKSCVEEDDDDMLIKADADIDVEDDDDDDEDEEKMEKGKKYKKSEDINIDASPILKAVVESNDLQTERIEALTKAVSTLADLVKSSEGKNKENEEIIKSLKDEVEKIGNQPVGTPGVKDVNDISNAVIVKSLSNEPMKISKHIVQGILLKGIKEQKIDSLEIDRFEMTPGSNISTLQKSTQDYIMLNLKGGIN